MEIEEQEIKLEEHQKRIDSQKNIILFQGARIRELEKRHESVYIEAEPGDALFFHANLLHSSDANKSQNSRRTLIVCFNTKSNNPYKEIGHASYNQLKVANHNSIMEYKID